MGLRCVAKTGENIAPQANWKEVRDNGDGDGGCEIFGDGEQFCSWHY